MTCVFNVCDTQKTIMTAMDMVCVDAAKASVISKLEGIPSLTEEQRPTLALATV